MQDEVQIISPDKTYAPSGVLEWDLSNTDADVVIQDITLVVLPSYSPISVSAVPEYCFLFLLIVYLFSIQYSVI